MSISQVSENVQWTLNRTVGPTTRPITLEQAKNHLRLSLTDTSYDSRIWDLIDASVSQVEKRTQRVLIHQTYEKIGTRFPGPGEKIPLDREPIVSVDTVTYLDDDGARQTLDSADYELSIARRGIFTAPNVSWPTTFAHHDAVIATFTAGYGTDGTTVPAELLEACYLLMTADFYSVDNRDSFEALVSQYLRTEYP
jgi:uncharacterized phiE125 gp8 family phage protein